MFLYAPSHAGELAQVSLLTSDTGRIAEPFFSTQTVWCTRQLSNIYLHAQLRKRKWPQSHFFSCCKLGVQEGRSNTASWVCLITFETENLSSLEAALYNQIAVPFERHIHIFQGRTHANTVLCFRTSMSYSLCESFFAEHVSVEYTMFKWNCNVLQPASTCNLPSRCVNLIPGHVGGLGMRLEVYNQYSS